MSQQNRNQRNHQHGRRNGNDRPRNPQGTRPVPREFNRGEPMDLVFIEEEFRGSVRVVAILSDGTIVHPGTFDDYRFVPVPVSVTYECSVMFGERVATALPRVPGNLTAQEWVHEKKIAACITATLVFRMSRGGDGRPPRLMSHHNDKVVFIDEGRENGVTEGSETLVQLIEKRNVYFAIPVKARARIEAPKALPFVVKNDARLEDQTKVVLRVYSRKPGVIVAQSMDDVLPKDDVRSIYTMLSSEKLGITVTADSTAEEIVSAAEKIAATLNGLINGKMSLQKLNAEKFVEALETAKSRALALLEGGADDVVEEGAEAKAEDGGQMVQAGNQSKKHRRGRRRGGKNRSRNGGERQAAAPVSTGVAQPAGPNNGSLGTFGDLVGHALTAAEPPIVSDETPVSVPAPVAVIASESDLSSVAVAKEEAVAVQQPDVPVAETVETIVVTSEAAPAVKEDSDEDEIVVPANDPNLMGLPAFHKPHSMEQVVAGVRYAIGKGKCKDVKTFRGLDLEVQRECIRIAKQMAKFARKASQKSNAQA